MPPAVVQSFRPQTHGRPIGSSTAGIRQSPWPGLCRIRPFRPDIGPSIAGAALQWRFTGVSRALHEESFPNGGGLLALTAPEVLIRLAPSARSALDLRHIIEPSGRSVPARCP